MGDVLIFTGSVILLAFVIYWLVSMFRTRRLKLEIRKTKRAKYQARWIKGANGE